MKLPRMIADAAVYKSTAHYGNLRPPVPAVTGVTPSFLPAGSYLRSCYACSTHNNNNFMICTCPNIKGDPVVTGIDNPYACSGAISNCNGSLTCGACPPYL